MFRKFLTIGVLGAALLAVPALFAPDRTGATALAQAAEVDTSTIVEMSLGDPDAPVTVVEYASFTCPHCATFHQSVFKDLKKDYIDTGKVHFIYREVYFDRYGLWASMVARCGGQERFFGIADMVYSTQSEWTAGGDPAAIVESLRRIGRTAGLSNEQLDACLSNADSAQTLVAWYQENAAADNVQSTPSFLIDGKPYSNMSLAEFSEAIDSKLTN